jgi:hypothetical protein
MKFSISDESTEPSINWQPTISSTVIAEISDIPNSYVLMSLGFDCISSANYP